MCQFLKIMDANTWFSLLTMLGEWGIVFVIYWELESNRLDHFLEDAFSSEHFEARKRIYEAYCGLAPPPGIRRNVAFKELLLTDEHLKQDCDRELTLLSKLGDRLPKLPPFRRRALKWFPHSVVFMWEILYPYVQHRREAAGRYWADSFIELALTCLKEMRYQGVKQLVILDPKLGRLQNIILTRERLAEIQNEIENVNVRSV
jgi:hypothetical protein